MVNTYNPNIFLFFLFNLYNIYLLHINIQSIYTLYFRFLEKVIDLLCIFETLHKSHLCLFIQIYTLQHIRN